MSEEGWLEPDVRFYRRRACEELVAAKRAVTDAARDRRVQLARSFLSRLEPAEAQDMLVEFGLSDRRKSSLDLDRARQPEVLAS